MPLLGFTQNSTVYITNEGNFGSGNGSLSIYNKITNSIQNNVFSTANGGALLGDVVQSMEYFDGYGYICVNNSSKIEVIDGDANYVATIPAISPRYLKKVSESKAYFSDWGIDGVQVIDLSTNTVYDTITCGLGPEGLAVSNGYVYVCNVGGFGLDSTVSIIDISTDIVVSTLTVGDKPNSAQIDVNGNIWILAGGYTEYDANWNVVSETAGVLAMINTLTNTIEKSFTFPVGNHPEDLVINGAGDKLYYSDGSWSKAVYEFDINSTTLSTTPIINRSFYGLGYDPISNEIYGSDAIDFVQQGLVFRYATTGAVIDSFEVGLIPGNFVFREDVLSTLNISNSDVSVYPNPSNNRFFINSNDLILSLEIRNILGAIIRNADISSFSDVIDLSDEERGVYLLNIKTSSGVLTKKLILD